MSAALVKAASSRGEAALARALLSCALDAFAQVPAPERQPALAALDRFLSAPSPASFLSAVRTLREVRQDSALRQARMSRAEQEFVRGLELVRREISPEVADVLSALPVFEDPAEPTGSVGAESRSQGSTMRRSSGVGARLRALALLAAAHQELADRVAGSAEKLRQHLARAQHAQGQEKPTPRRRSPVSRGARQSTTTSTKT
jgi:hypothetical protein